MDARYRPLLVRYAIALAAGLLALNLGITLIERNNPARVLASRLQTPSENSYVFIGNSLIAAGIDTAVCSRQQLACLNLGIGSTQTSEHAAIAGEAIATRIRGKLIYGFMDLTLSESPEAGWKGNRAVAFQLKHINIPESYGLSGPAVFEFNLRRSLPILTYQDSLWAKVERFRRVLSDKSLQKRTATNNFGRASDFSALEDGSGERFAERVRKAMTKPSLLCPEVERLFSVAVKDKREVVFVVMPMPAKHRNTYYRTSEWQAYLDRLASELDTKGARLVNMDEMALDSDFTDAVHLSPAGATAFTEFLLPELVRASVRRVHGYPTDDSRSKS
ncbi:MAG: hypothetical protein ACKO14_12170 [Armatimonadota bacterium]